MCVKNEIATAIIPTGDENIFKGYKSCNLRKYIENGTLNSESGPNPGKINPL